MPENKNSKARIEANNRYNAKAYDRINLAVHKGQKDIIQSEAAKTGESLNAYIIRAVEAQMHGGVGSGISSGESSGISLCHFFSHAELEKISTACREGETAEEFVRRVVLAALDDAKQPTRE